MSCKLVFGARIENSTLDNHADQREMVILFSLLFFGVAMSKAITSDFSSATDSSTGPKKTTSCVTPCIYCFCLQERRPRHIMWVLPRPQYWFENLLNSNALKIWWTEIFRITRETFCFISAAVACYPATRHYTSSS